MERSDSPLGLTPTASLPPGPASPNPDSLVIARHSPPWQLYLEGLANGRSRVSAIALSGIFPSELVECRAIDAESEAAAIRVGMLGSSKQVARLVLEGRAHHMAARLLHEADHAEHARDRIKAAAEALDRGGVGAAPSSLSLTQTNFYLSSLGVTREAPSPAAEAVEPPGQ